MKVEIMEESTSYAIVLTLDADTQQKIRHKLGLKDASPGRDAVTRWVSQALTDAVNAERKTGAGKDRVLAFRM